MLKYHPVSNYFIQKDYITETFSQNEFIFLSNLVFNSILFFFIIFEKSLFLASNLSHILFKYAESTGLLYLPEIFFVSRISGPVTHLY